MCNQLLTWHMYWPRSSIRTFRMTSVQVLKSLWVTDKRSLFVMTCSCIARIAFASAFIHATYTNRINKYTEYYFMAWICSTVSIAFRIFWQNRDRLLSAFHSTDFLFYALMWCVSESKMKTYFFHWKWYFLAWKWHGC